MSGVVTAPPIPIICIVCIVCGSTGRYASSTVAKGFWVIVRILEEIAESPLKLRRSLPALSAWAEAHGQTIGALAHAWLLAQPQVCSVISGATKLEHVMTNAKASDWVLTAEEMPEVNAILAGER